MQTGSLYDRMTAADILGIDGSAVPERAHTDTTPGIARSVGPSPSNSVPPWSPDNAMFWFGALAAVTFGLVAISTSVRVGPGRASVSLGKP
jgi:hypothetical protein